MKRFLSAALAVLLLLLPVSVYATEEAPLYPYGDAAAYWYEEYEEAAEFTGDLKVKSAYLTDYGTGRVLYAFNENERRPIASVTKIMTTLLVFEALDDGRISYGDTVTVSDYAASMGGSQVYLEPGEQMELRDMLKALIVSSANDATVALAEHIAGSVETFTSMMNNRAHELGMDNTHFANPHGLDDENHYSSAKDVAIMTRELLSHPDVTGFTTIWMDTIRGGEFGLANTNKLIRFYNGANGMKTGFTNAAGFLRKKNIRSYAERLIEKFDVRSGQGPITIARSMSGGNQQKAIVAREIDKDPELLIAVQPTRGLDVGAIEYIHKQIVAHRDEGKAVLLVSLELEEVMSLSDRILVMYEGELVGELDPKETTVEELGLYMAGAKRSEVSY